MNVWAVSTFIYNNYKFIYMPLTSYGSSFSQWEKREIDVTSLRSLSFVSALHVQMQNLRGSSTRILRIKVAGPSLKSILDNYRHLAIDLWFNEKERRLGQKHRKKCRKRKSTKKLPSESSICCHYLKQVAKVNWKNLVQINVYWWHWHYFTMYIFYWNVYYVNYMKESFAWKYIAKFTVTNKLTWKFAKVSDHKTSFP